MLVKLTYFKYTGKYYASGEYETTQPELWEIFNEVRDKLEAKQLPGLLDGCGDFYVLVNVPEHKNNHPALIISSTVLQERKREESI